MKKIFIISFLVIATAFNFTACKSDTKKEESKTEEIESTTKSESTFSVTNAKNEINFTAYKTSEKVAVGGQFKEINIIAGGEGNSVKEAINNTEFSIPVSSLFTKDTSRDFKVKKFFFGMMEDTQLLSGKLMITDDANGTAEIKMNGVSKNVPFTYTIVDKTFNMKATMHINNWNASKALEALNKACFDLHKGADGVSKTWNDVALDITTTF
ncbi:YceI-like domain-containing protein [Polaribacter sp. KT25b]|uniref:YceI family protein n=1 Tax=Polaribacter sp. KT25b TaxID=1855336 RepID=UPI00087D9F1C|nr:YceI family protein [Polaribacter sp. KT25b]SDR76529.1 YceI-like domain-containing protein [Polaribacter sp. KT25b]